MIHNISQNKLSDKEAEKMRREFDMTKEKLATNEEKLQQEVDMV